MTNREAIHRKLKEVSEIPEGEAHIVVLLSDHVRRDPDDVKAVLAYADALRIVGRQAEAADLFRRVFSSAVKKTDQSYVAIQIGRCLERAHPQEAEEWYVRATDLEGTLPGWAWVLRGANLATLERFEAAIDCYARALKSKDVDRDEALRNVAMIYRAKGDYETFGAYIKRALAAAPRDRELKDLNASLKGLEETRSFAIAHAGAA